MTTNIIPLFKCTAETFTTSVKRAYEHENDFIWYADTYGAPWRIKVQGDLIAVAVNWMAKDFVENFGYLGDATELMDAFIEYDYLELFDNYPDFRPNEMLGLGLARTYIEGLIANDDYVDVWN